MDPGWILGNVSICQNKGDYSTNREFTHYKNTCNVWCIFSIGIKNIFWCLHWNIAFVDESSLIMRSLWMDRDSIMEIVLWEFSRGISAVQKRAYLLKQNDYHAWVHSMAKQCFYVDIVPCQKYKSSNEKKQTCLTKTVTRFYPPKKI